MEAMETASYGRSGDVASDGYIFPFPFINQMRYVKLRIEVVREASKDDTGRHHRRHTYLRRGYAPTILGDAWFAAKARPYDHALWREYPLCRNTHG